MAHATPTTIVQVIAILALIGCVIAASRGHRFLADVAALPVIVALAVVFCTAGKNGPAVAASIIGLAAVYRVGRALKAGALR